MEEDELPVSPHPSLPCAAESRPRTLPREHITFYQMLLAAVGVVVDGEGYF